MGFQIKACFYEKVRLILLIRNIATGEQIAFKPPSLQGFLVVTDVDRIDVTHLYNWLSRYIQEYEIESRRETLDKVSVRDATSILLRKLHLQNF